MKTLVVALLALAAVVLSTPATNAQGSGATELVRSYPVVRTSNENRAQLAAVGVGVKHSSTATTGSRLPGVLPLETIEQTIRHANIQDPETLRRPVPVEKLVQLRQRLTWRHGLPMSLVQVQASTDYAHALLRESPSKSLSNKWLAASIQERAPLHGVLAELSEARQRGMVLTRDPRSRTFDLTEDRIRPRNAQLKIYQNEVRAVYATIQDLRDAPIMARRGIATRAAIDQALARGTLAMVANRGSTLYRSTDGLGVRFEESRVFQHAGQSRANAALGKGGLERAARGSQLTLHAARFGFGTVLLTASAADTFDDLHGILDSDISSEEAWLRLGQHGSQTFAGTAMVGAEGLVAASAWTQSSKLARLSRWTGRAGTLGLVVAEGFIVAEWYRGHLTDRQFYRGQAELAGSLVGATGGGWVGAKAGILVGGTIGGCIGGPPGAAVGATIGGAVGAFGGSVAGGLAGGALAGLGAGAVFDFKDKEQEAAFASFLAKHYGLPR